jgi:hypothetical protein
MDSWPVSLQQLLNQDGFEYRPGNTRVSSGTDVGPSKVRSRFTDAVDIYTGEVVLDFDQVATFKTFYKTTIGNGTLPFLFEDPFTGDEIAVRFLPDNDPSIRPLGGRVFTLNFTWEVMP